MDAGPARGTVLVVGYGNPLRTDDGAGPAVAERLALDPRMAGVDVRSAHQLTPELALDASGASLLVLVDAADGPRAGEVAVRRVGFPAAARGAAETVAAAGVSAPEDPEWPAAPAASAPSEPPMTHHLDPEALLGLAGSLFGAAPPAVIISIGVASLEVGERLTPDVEAGVSRAVDLVARIVEDHRRA